MPVPSVEVQIYGDKFRRLTGALDHLNHYATYPEDTRLIPELCLFVPMTCMEWPFGPEEIAICMRTSGLLYPQKKQLDSNFRFLFDIELLRRVPKKIQLFEHAIDTPIQALLRLKVEQKFWKSEPSVYRVTINALLNLYKQSYDSNKHKPAYVNYYGPLIEVLQKKLTDPENYWREQNEFFWQRHFKEWGIS